LATAPRERPRPTAAVASSGRASLAPPGSPGTSASGPKRIRSTAWLAERPWADARALRRGVTPGHSENACARLDLSAVEAPRLPLIPVRILDLRPADARPIAVCRTVLQRWRSRRVERSRPKASSAHLFPAYSSGDAPDEGDECAPSPRPPRSSHAERRTSGRPRPLRTMRAGRRAVCGVRSPPGAPVPHAHVTSSEGRRRESGHEPRNPDVKPTRLQSRP
jgi:hypothetical protein